MKFWIVIALLCINNLLSAQQADTLNELPKVVLANEYNSWKELRSYEGGFRILMPGEVDEKMRTIATDIGDLKYHTFLCQMPTKGSDNLIYILSYCDYPEGGMHSDSTELLADFFEATVDAAAQSVKGDLVYTNAIDYKGFPAQIWRIDYLRGTAVIKTKALLVDNRFYSIQTITKKDRNLNLSTEKFFDSFSLLDRD